jgi:hypothetical protein
VPGQETQSGPVRLPRRPRRRLLLGLGRKADYAVAILRVEAGHSPYSKDLTDLIGELATRSGEFKTRWAAHHVRAHRRGTKRLHHPVVGDLTLRFEALEIPDSGGLTMFAYTAEPGSASEDALRLLGSWAATPEADVTEHQTTPFEAE